MVEQAIVLANFALLGLICWLYRITKKETVTEVELWIKLVRFVYNFLAMVLLEIGHPFVE
jgi:uncharacterized membrane protein YeiB